MTTHPGYDRLQRMVQLKRPAEEVWAEIGGFGSVADWHPAIAEAEILEIEGETHRHLRTADGSLILERLTDSGPLHYAYEIVESPLPLSGYRSHFSCVPDEAGCHVFWSGHYEATDPAADEIVAGIYESGLRAIRERFPDPA